MAARLQHPQAPGVKGSRRPAPGCRWSAWPPRDGAGAPCTPGMNRGRSGPVTGVPARPGLKAESLSENCCQPCRPGSWRIIQRLRRPEWAVGPTGCESFPRRPCCASVEDINPLLRRAVPAGKVLRSTTGIIFRTGSEARWNAAYGRSSPRCARSRRSAGWPGADGCLPGGRHW